MIEPRNPWLRVMFVVVGVALALRLTWLLIRPLLPVLAVVVAVAATWQLVRWWRQRW